MLIGADGCVRIDVYIDTGNSESLMLFEVSHPSFHNIKRIKMRLSMIELPNATLVSVDGNEDAEEVFGKEISVHPTFEFLMGYIASLE